jgi:hypothetical protein
VFLGGVFFLITQFLREDYFLHDCARKGLSSFEKIFFFGDEGVSNFVGGFVRKFFPLLQEKETGFSSFSSFLKLRRLFDPSNSFPPTTFY